MPFLIGVVGTLSVVLYVMGVVHLAQGKGLTRPVLATFFAEGLWMTLIHRPGYLLPLWSLTLVTFAIARYGAAALVRAKAVVDRKD